MSKISVRIFMTVLTCFISSMCYSTTLEVRGAAFTANSGRFREIYGDVRPDVQIEASTHWRDCYDVWANFDWFSKKHKESGFCDYKTTIELPSVSAGLRYAFPRSCLFNDIEFYVGLGMTVTQVYLKNHACDFRERWSKVGVGGVLKTGMNYYFTESLFVDVFADYSYQPIKMHRHFDVGGIKLGGGLGVRF